MRGTVKNLRAVPFYQGLASITASGKTVVLADAISTMAAVLPLPPIVLWLSKGKVVVDQSFANLAPGGKYHHLLGGCQVSYLAQYKPEDIREASATSIYFATVGTFNERDRADGTRLIFKSEIDTADESIWEMLKLRLAAEGSRRPLIIVYDEGHNLTDLQMELLLELEPDALVAASATLRLSTQLADEIRALKDAGWADEELVTSVNPKAVADSGLVKSQIHIGGYQAPMEQTIDALIADMRKTEDAARVEGIGLPKAIYVCKTNMVEGNTLQKDNPKQPFNQRRSPPILIWCYLTEVCGIDPSEIAVYCSLKFAKDFPPPADFRLFTGKDKDYDDFVAGGFRHVIFNLSLQEGWDDPLAYFAYIDKSMESRIQVEQIIGRLLRQPDAEHYSDERLNTAHFYIRVDKRGVFNQILEGIDRKLSVDAPGIKLVATKPGKPKPDLIEAKEAREIFETAYVTDDAVGPIEQLIDGLTDYRGDSGVNVESKGGRVMIQRSVGGDSGASFDWEEFEHTNRVSARWLFQREIMRRFQGALGVAPTSSPKFDALIGFGSRAHIQIQHVAKEIVNAYIDNVYLKQKSLDCYVVGPTYVRQDQLEPFRHALHEGYSDLNELEKKFAHAIDKLGIPWFRNPPKSGYNIPLISVGPTRNFYPDFMVWKGKDVFAIDTTGGHLLKDKTNRKLLTVLPPKAAVGALHVRFVSEGTWSPDVEQEDSAGFTVWSRKPDNNLRATHVDSIGAAVERAITGDA